jgi:hypothetical protein
MNKAWVGYLASAMIMVAAILMVIDKSYALAGLLAVISIVGFVLKWRMNKRQDY